MRVKLRELNGSCYILIKKEVKEMLLIDKEVDVTIENNKIVVSPIKKEEDK
jgi:antitoxin component of MazEF toxin-antitoxin module